jgi:hypothetical protein
MSFAQLLCGDVGCDCFDVDHCRKSLSNNLYFLTALIIADSVLFVKCFDRAI